MAANNGTSGTIRFLQNGVPREIAGADPNRTVLQWLREDERRTGTKEGCAEGDCGACTVVLGEPDGSGLRYRAVNACILFLPMLDGKDLITVEDLADKTGALHPVQQAMVDLHGSQCGFCTPGFVMSILAHMLGGGAAERGAINDAIAGNLCRCTGYRPIIDAAMAALGTKGKDRFARRAKTTLAALRKIRRREMLVLDGTGVSGQKRKYFAPVTSDELADVLTGHKDATIVAGGTDVGLWVTKLHRDLDVLVATGGVRDLAGMAVEKGVLSVGAAVRLTDAMDRLGGMSPSFGELMRRFASVQIRNSGTLVGNVANGSPIGDTMPALLALGATVTLRRGTQTRELALEDFYLGYQKTALAPGEFVARVNIPLPDAGVDFRTWKISKRFDQDISAVCAAFAVRVVDGKVASARIGMGGVAAIPVRAPKAEAALTGKPWTLATVLAASRAMEQDFQPLTDMRASAAYRMTVAKNLLRKFYFEIAEPENAGDVVGFGA